MNEHSCNIIVNNQPTDIVLKVYSNKILLIVTQMKKIGPLLQVTRESSVNDCGIFTVKTIFGRSSAEIYAAVRYIAEEININKPLVLTLVLKDYKVHTLRSIVDAVNHLQLFASF